MKVKGIWDHIQLFIDLLVELAILNTNLLVSAAILSNSRLITKQSFYLQVGHNSFFFFPLSKLSIMQHQRSSKSNLKNYGLVNIH